MEEGHEDSSFCGLDDDSVCNVDRDGGLSVMKGCFFLDHVGQVLLSRNPDGLSWKCLDSSDCVRSVDNGICSMLPQTTLVFLDFYLYAFFFIFNRMCMNYSVVCVGAATNIIMELLFSLLFA